MQYKTIAIELLECQPLLSQKLKDSNTLHSTMEIVAMQLRSNHLQRVQAMQEQLPDESIEVIRSQGFELEVDRLQQILNTMEEVAGLPATTGKMIQNRLMMLMAQSAPRKP